MKILKKITQSNFGVKFRNSIKFRQIIVNLRNKENNYSISDAFPWRTDNNFKTFFRFSNILEHFFSLKNSNAKIYFFDDNGDLIKIKEMKNITHNNDMIIDKNFIGKEGYGSFYIFHETNEIDNNSIRNSCYTGFSYNESLYSFVHGNTMAAYKNFNGDENLERGIVETSLFSNNSYFVQKKFKDYERVEFFLNNCSKNQINFEIQNTRYFLETGQSKIINLNQSDLVRLKSNSMFLRPIAFLYRKNFIDVFHC